MSEAASPTVVLVHGAFADASSWNGVIERLQAKGVAVKAPANPLRGIATDSAYSGDFAACQASQIGWRCPSGSMRPAPERKAPTVRARRFVRSLIIASAMVVSIASVAVAEAATVTTRTPGDHPLRYVAAPGEINNVTLDDVSGGEAIRITDPGAVISVSGRCRSIDAHTAECRGPGRHPIFYVAKLDLGDLDDRLQTITPREEFEITAQGGPGNDLLIAGVKSEEGSFLSGGQGDDQLYGTTSYDGLRGGDGRDRLFAGNGGADDLNGGLGDDILFGGQDRFDGDHLDGGGGQDQLYGGPGRDRLTDGDVSDSAVSGAGPGPDVMAGGAGSDVLSYQGRTRPVTVRAGRSADNGELGERDSTSGIEALLGGNADDVLIGDERPNTLAGGPGDDTLDCGAGGDLVESPDVSVVVPRSCEQLFFEWDCNRNGCLRSLQVEAQPVTAGTGGLKLKIMCPYIYDASNIGCRGTTSLRETAGSHRQLGRGSFRHPADSSFWFRIPIALTTPGAQWWKQGLLTDTAAVNLTIHAKATPSQPFLWNITPPTRE